MDWTDKSHSPLCTTRTGAELEEAVLGVRQHLLKESASGEYGARAIREELLRMGIATPPAVRTVGRILKRHGVLDANRRVRRPPPPRGWYLPDVRAAKAELDSFDVVEDLCLGGALLVDVLNGISLHGRLCMSCPWDVPFIAPIMLTAIERHWREFGLPTYAQFDNDSRFAGNRLRPNAIGRMMRFCLSLGITPVFAPPLEHGLQNSIEHFNGLWRSKVWNRFHHGSLEQLLKRSDAFVAAHRRKMAPGFDLAPARYPFPGHWQLTLSAPPLGRLVFIRRTDEHGGLRALGQRFEVDDHWPHRLVRVEVALAQSEIAFYRLRRSAPDEQPLIRKISHRIATRLPTKLR